LFFAFAAVFTPCTPADSVAQHPNQANGWRLIHTANPRGGPDAVSISHTADIGRSDLDFAGIMVRCGEKMPEFIIVAITPFPPRAHPEVTIGAAGKEWRFDARVLPPGAELLLPSEAMDLANGRWQSAHELAVKVASPTQSFSGVVAIDGLAQALANLISTCPAN